MGFTTEGDENYPPAIDREEGRPTRITYREGLPRSAPARPCPDKLKEGD